jgi:integrase
MLPKERINRMQFTNANIGRLALPAGKADHVWWDPELPGFGVRLRGTTARWVVQYRFGTRQRRESLGDPRKVTLDDARKAARQRFAQLELGVDPAAERDKVRAEAAATRLTLAVVGEKYLEARRRAIARPATLKATTRHLKTHWAPLRNRPIAEIKRVDVAARIGEIAKTNGRVSAARARSTLSAMYSWAMREGLCEANPVVATNDPSEGIKSRARTLGGHELRAIWHACRDDDFGRVVRLLILTGCRRTEIGDLRWSEIDLDTGLLAIPGTRTKNHRPLELTLPSPALDILRSIPHRPGRDHVFGQRGAGLTGWSYPLSRLNLRIAETEGRPLAAWTLHDLRRTMRTGLGRLGVAPHVAELVIGHHVGGVQAIYDKHRYQPEIADALARWANHVAAVVEGGGGNMVALRA